MSGVGVGLEGLYCQLLVVRSEGVSLLSIGIRIDPSVGVIGPDL